MVDRVRVLLFSLPGLLEGILSNTLGQDDGFDVVIRAGGNELLPEAVNKAGADVVIAGGFGFPHQPFVMETVEQHPRIKVFNIQSDGRQTLLCQLHPECRNLGQLAPRDLAWQIHNVVEKPFRFWHSPADPGTPS